MTKDDAISQWRLQPEPQLQYYPPQLRQCVFGALLPKSGYELLPAADALPAALPALPQMCIRDSLEALRAVTVNGAYQYGEEGEKGTLAPGKRADLVLLSGDPLACPPHEIGRLRVVRTIKDGKTLFEA